MTLEVLPVLLVICDKKSICLLNFPVKTAVWITFPVILLMTKRILGGFKLLSKITGKPIFYWQLWDGITGM